MSLNSGSLNWNSDCNLYSINYKTFRPLTASLISIHVSLGETFKKAILSASFFGKGNRAFKALHNKDASDLDFSPIFTTQYLLLKTLILLPPISEHLDTIPRFMLAKVVVMVVVVEVVVVVVLLYFVPMTSLCQMINSKKLIKNE